MRLGVLYRRRLYPVLSYRTLKPKIRLALQGVRVSGLGLLLPTIWSTIRLSPKCPKSKEYPIGIRFSGQRGTSPEFCQQKTMATAGQAACSRGLGV